jgi:type I restriction enzyme S subunit
MGQAPAGSSVNEDGIGTPFYRSGEFGEIRPSTKVWTTTPLRTSTEEDVWVCVVGANAGQVNLGANGAIGRSIGAIATGPNLDQRFLYYFLKTQEMAMRNASQGSVQAVITKTHLARLEVPYPTIEEQRAISATLRALDDKIESNQRLIEIVPRLIRAVVGQALSVESVEIPVTGLASFVNGGAYTKGASGSGRLVIRIAELNSGPGASTVYSNIEVPDDKTAQPGDLLMSWSGSLGMYRWFRDEAIINQHIFKVLPSDGYPAWLVFDRLDYVMPVFQGIAKDKATTMGHIQRGHLESTTVHIPTPNSVAMLDHQLAPLWDRLLLAEREDVKLSALRDALLPELLSGRVRVSEAAEAVT